MKYYYKISQERNKWMTLKYGCVTNQRFSCSAYSKSHDFVPFSSRFVMFLTIGIQSHRCLVKCFLFNSQFLAYCLIGEVRRGLQLTSIKSHPPTRIRGNNPKFQKFCAWFVPARIVEAGLLRAMCGLRTGGWLLPGVMSDWQHGVNWFFAKYYRCRLWLDWCWCRWRTSVKGRC
jgi:hypothetical protein